jgi:hypothetical protein
MADELMEFPSELIQKEFAKDPSKLLNSMNHIKEIPSKNKNSIEQKEKLTDKNNNLSNIILNNTKENLHSKKDLDSIEKNKNDININVNFFNIKDIGANINNVEYINNVNNIKNNFFVNNNYNYDGNNINGIKNSLININEIICSNDSYSKLNISENNHFPQANVNNNPFSKNGNLFGYIFSPNIKNNNININGNKNILFNNANLILMNLKTYKGSIFVQEFLDELNNNELNTLFVNLMPHISFIMCLEYGNYFFQKLIKKLNLQQRLEIYKIIEPNFLEIATNKSGTHSIQSLIECINSPIELIVFDKLLNKNRLILFLNENAYHIIMKIILEIDEDKRNNLNLFLVSNVEKIITNCNGAFCVNKFIHKNKNLQLRYILVQNLKNNIQNLIGNKYGCTILLLVLEQFGTNYGLFIVKYIQNNLSLLSLNQITVVFIMKTLNYLYKYNNFELGILIWYVYKDNKLINYLLSHENGTHILKQMINLSDEEQKNYILLKMCKKEVKEE